MVYFKGFRITAAANKINYDSGLASTTEEPKRLLSVLVQVEKYDSEADVQGYFEREKVFDIPSELIDTKESTGSTNTQKSFNRINEIEVGMDLPVGSTFKAAIKCGAVDVDLVGAYRYEIVK